MVRSGRVRVRNWRKSYCGCSHYRHAGTRVVNCQGVQHWMANCEVVNDASDELKFATYLASLDFYPMIQDPIAVGAYVSV